MNRALTRLPIAAACLLMALPVPLQAYYDDVHYALTYYIARQSGYTPLQAYRIASACSAVDWDPDTEPVQPIGQIRVLFDKALIPLAIGTRLIPSGAQLLVGFNPLENGAEVPRWKFHAMRNEAVYRDVIGRGAGSQESQTAVLQQREQLLRFAIEQSKNPGVFLHGFEDEAPHHGYGTRWGHWPALEGEADRHGGMPIGGTTDWISFRPGDVAAVGPAASQYLARFMNAVSPHQRWRPSSEADYARLIPALVAANRFPAALDSQLKRELYIQYYARENGTELRRLGTMNNPSDLSDLGAQLSRISLSREDLAKQKGGPDVAKAIQAVNQALRDAGMDDSVPPSPLSYDLNVEGALAEESQLDSWVLTGSLEISVQSADPVPATYQATVKMKPTRKGEPEYELHGLPKAQFRAGRGFRWENLPIGDLIVEVRTPSGDVLRREVTLRARHTVLEPIVAGPSFPSGPRQGPVWVLTSNSPLIRGGDIHGTMDTPPTPPFSASATSASFSDPQGQYSGTANWDAPPAQLAPGQRVRIRMAATKMIASMSWSNGVKGASGYARNFGVRDPWDPPRGTLDTYFEFEPNPRFTATQFGVTMRAEPPVWPNPTTRIRSVYVTWLYQLAPAGSALPAANAPTAPAPPPPPSAPPAAPAAPPPPPATSRATPPPPQAAPPAAPQLERKQLDDFIRLTVPAGPTANAAGVDGDCPPGQCGELSWDGEVTKGMLVTIDGSRVSAGTLEGALPGTPVRIINDMPPEDVTLIEQPSARNGWRKLVFRVNFEGGFTFSLKWKAR